MRRKRFGINLICQSMGAYFELGRPQGRQAPFDIGHQEIQALAEARVLRIPNGGIENAARPNGHEAPP